MKRNINKTIPRNQIKVQVFKSHLTRWSLTMPTTAQHKDIPPKTYPNYDAENRVVEGVHVTDRIASVGRPSTSIGGMLTIFLVAAALAGAYYYYSSSEMTSTTAPTTTEVSPDAQTGGATMNSTPSEATPPAGMESAPATPTPPPVTDPPEPAPTPQVPPTPAPPPAGTQQ